MYLLNLKNGKQNILGARTLEEAKNFSPQVVSARNLDMQNLKDRAIYRTFYPLPLNDAEEAKAKKDEAKKRAKL